MNKREIKITTADISQLEIDNAAEVLHSSCIIQCSDVAISMLSSKYNIVEGTSK